jgi:hypothetical protein
MGGVSLCSADCGGWNVHQLVPDGVGGLVVRATTQQPNQAPQPKLIHLDSEWQRTDFSKEGRIDLVGDAGTIYLQTRTSPAAYNGITEAFNVVTGASLWTVSPGWDLLAAAPDGGAIAKGSLLHINGAGQITESTPLDVLDPVHAYGEWVGQSAGELRSIKGDVEDVTRFDSRMTSVGVGFVEPLQFGYGTGQNAPPKSFWTRDEAALRALDHLYPLSVQANVEHGGLICRSGSKFVWSSRFVTSLTQDEVDVPDTLCPKGTLAAHLHTHPPLYESPFPSGNDSQGLPLSGDYKGAWNHQGIPYYLRARNGRDQTLAPWDLKYWRSEDRRPSQNLYLRVGGTFPAVWQPYIPGAMCSTP